MDYLLRLLKDPKTNNLDVEKSLYEFLSQPDLMGSRIIADYSQQCDLIRGLISNLDVEYSRKLFIAAKNLIKRAGKKSIKERPEYVKQLVLTGPVIDRSLIAEMLHMLDKANRINNSGEAKEVYNTVLGVIVGERYELPSEWWKIQAKESQFPKHLLSAYVHREGWDGVLAAFELAGEKKSILNVEDLLLLIDIARIYYELSTSIIVQIMQTSEKLGSNIVKKIEHHLGGPLIGRALIETEYFKRLNGDFAASNA